MKGPSRSDLIAGASVAVIVIPQALAYANLAGVPGISLPCGFSSNGLPIGLQLQAPTMQLGNLIDYQQHHGRIVRRLRFALHIQQHDDQHHKDEPHENMANKACSDLSQYILFKDINCSVPLTEYFIQGF